jgi:osmotically-inducible protein OsmY
MTRTQLCRLPHNTAGDEIARRGLDVLRWSAVVPRDSVKLAVHDGWVRLTGDVDGQFQRKAAENHIRKLDGVSGVINEGWFGSQR